MSANQGWLSQPGNVDAARGLYRAKDRIWTMAQIANELGVSESTVRAALKGMSAEERRALRAVKHSHSKIGAGNPQWGKRGADSNRYVGDCEDGYGYLTRVVDGERYFVHRIVAAEMLGLHVGQLPQILVVHHIDENKKNNSPDNLAICTRKGHHAMHALQGPISEKLKWRVATVADAAKYLI